MRVIPLTLLVAICSLVPISYSYMGKNESPPTILATEEEAFLKWKLIEKSMQDGVAKLMNQVTERSTGSDVQINPKCMSDLVKVMSGLSKLKLWAIKLLDSIGKPASGMLMVTASALGNYDECVDIVFPQSEKSKQKGLKPTTGQYCIVELSVPLPPKPKMSSFTTNAFKNVNSTFDTEVMGVMKENAFALYYGGGFSFGLCIPSTCTEVDLNQMIDAALNNTQAITTGNVHSCEIKRDIKMDTIQTTIVSLIAAFVFAIIVCTILDLTMADEKCISRKMISAFSFHRHFIATFEIKESSGHMLESINGLRVVSLMWVILYHNYTQLEPRAISNALRAKEIMEDVFMQPIINGTLAVQTFFVIAGVLVAYNLVKAYDSRGISAVNMPLILVRRIWRLLPPVLLLIGFGVLTPLLGSGPLYQDFASFYSDNCRNNWWYYVLFLQNFLDPTEACFVHTWYIGAEFQLYLLALVYCALLCRWPSISKLYLVLMSTGSVLATAAVIYIWNLPPTLLLSDPDLVSSYLRKVYYTPYAQIGGYVLALSLGTFMARREKLIIPKVVVILGWSISITLILTLFCCALPWNSERFPTTLESVMYGSLQRPVWGLCICWFILACGYGYSGFMGRILSWNGLQPLVKLSYVAYIVHFAIHYFKLATITGTTDIAHINLVWTFMATFSLSLLAAAVIRIMFEGPLIELDQIFVSWLCRNEKQKVENVQIAHRQ